MSHSMSSDRKRLALLERESPFFNPSQSFRADLHPDNVLAEVVSEVWSQEDAPLHEFEDETPFDRPTDVPKLPTEAALRDALGKSKLKEVRALAGVMKLFGKPNEFGQALRAALQFIPWEDEPGSSTFRVAFARIGVEAFLLGTTVPEENRVKTGFIDYPSRITDASSPGQRQFFIHFAVELLRQRATKDLVPLQHRRELSSATALFVWLHNDLRRPYSLSGIPEALLVAYRRLLVVVASRHYQALQDALWNEMRRSPASTPDVQKALKGYLDTIATMHVDDKSATVPTYHMTSKVYRDYFAPKVATDIEYSHYTTGPLPMALQAFDTPFRGVVRTAVRQHEVVEDLVRVSGTRTLPVLQDSASWQAWLRGLWNETWRGLFALERLSKVLKLVEAHARAFTIHVPFDLREGCKVDSYLTRTFPRAVTGARVHDCAVYAVRWLHVLGGIISAKSPAAGVTKPRIFLVEMPAHVGVMIRLNPTNGVELLVAINNEHAEVHTDIDEKETDEQLARTVVADMYGPLKTPFRLHKLSSDPADARALSSETCKLFDKKLDLPYKGPGEPHLRYLQYKAGVAALSAGLANHLRGLRGELEQKLAGQPTPKQVTAAVGPYMAEIEKAVKVTNAEYVRVVQPLIAEIATDLDNNKDKWRPESAADGLASDTRLPWILGLRAYQISIKPALQTGKLPVPDPEVDFGDDHFPAAGGLPETPYLDQVQRR